MTAFLVAVVALLVVVNLFNNRLLPGVYTRTCILTATLLLLSARQAGLTTTDLGLALQHLGRATAWSAVLTAAVAVAVVALVRHPRWQQLLYDDRAGRLRGRELVFHALVRIPLGTVLLEEVAFRAVLFGAIARDHGMVAGAVGSSLLFGLWHLLPSAASTADSALGRSVLGTGRAARVRGATVAVLVTALAGVALCWLRTTSGSLLTPAMVHWATNALSLVGAWTVLHRSGGDAQHVTS